MFSCLSAFLLSIEIALSLSQAHSYIHPPLELFFSLSLSLCFSIYLPLNFLIKLYLVILSNLSSIQYLKNIPLSSNSPKEPTQIE